MASGMSAQFAALQQEWPENGLVSSEAVFNKTLFVKSGRGQDLSSTSSSLLSCHIDAHEHPCVLRVGEADKSLPTRRSRVTKRPWTGNKTFNLGQRCHFKAINVDR